MVKHSDMSKPDVEIWRKAWRYGEELIVKASVRDKLDLLQVLSDVEKSIRADLNGNGAELPVTKIVFEAVKR